MARLFSSLSASGLVLLLVACGSADGDALFSASTPPTALGDGAGGNGATAQGEGGSDDAEGGQGEGGSDGTSGSGGAGKSGTSGQGEGGEDPGTEGEGGTEAGVFGGSGGDPQGVGGTESGAAGDGGSESGGQSAGGAPQGEGGMPPGPGPGGGGKPGSGGAGQAGKGGSGGSGQAGKAGSSGSTTTGDGVKCAMTDGDAVGACKGAGKGCCLDSSGPNPCVTSEQCTVGQQDNSYFGYLGCDGPEDCGTGRCCVGKTSYDAQCRASCDQEKENEMCHPGLGGILGCTLAGKSCQPLVDADGYDTGGIYYECR